MKSPTDKPRRHVLHESNYRQLLADRPNVAVLPWGATEAHGYHLPHGTDCIEAEHLAIAAAGRAMGRGARPIVLPTIPFGNDEQQLDQVATISITTTTAFALLRDVVRSLSRQKIDRLIIINGHGGNEFKPLIRDLMGELDVLIVLINLYQLHPYPHHPAVTNKGDHACEMETSLCLHLCPQLVVMEQAGTGSRNAFEIEGLTAAGVWTPRPWGAVHPDTGSGDPSHATAEKGMKYFELLCAATSDVIVNISASGKGKLPYL